MTGMPAELHHSETDLSILRCVIPNMHSFSLKPSQCHAKCSYRTWGMLAQW